MTASGTAGGPAGPGPVVAGVSPPGGPTGGGTSVTVTGTGLLTATKVSFGSEEALDLSRVSDTKLTVTSPPTARSGAVDVTVTTTAGTSALSEADQFTYVATGLTFLSWYRTGLSAAVQPPATGAALDTPPPAAVTTKVTVKIGDPGNPSTSETATVQVRLHAPGDVTGLDPAQIIRTYPAPGAAEVLPGRFPLIEFARPDVPWMLSPTGPQQPFGTDPRWGLIPWLCLVVVPEPPATLSPPATPDALPTLTVIDSELPDPTATWPWAHTQVTTLATDDHTQALPDLITQQPERALSRLLAPRFLRENTPYLACVVPAFAPPGGASTLSPAWQHASPPALVPLPVYYSWRFTTGSDQADFQTLVRRLKRQDQSGTGIRPLDVGDAGPGMPSPAAGQGPWLINLEGALVSSDVTIGTWGTLTGSGGQSQIQDALAVRLGGMTTPPVPASGTAQGNTAGAPVAVKVSGGAVTGIAVNGTTTGLTSGTVIVPPAGEITLTYTVAPAWSWTLADLAPPVYGGTQASFTGQLSAGQGPVWLRALNLDPRYRAAASLGAALVRDNQEALILSAWDQAGQARTANLVLRQGQLARELGQSTYTRRIGSPGSAAPALDDDRLLQLTCGVHDQVPAPSTPAGSGQQSVADALAVRPAVAAVLSVPFRRAASPAGPLASRLATGMLPPPVTSVAKAGGIAPTPPLSAVTGMMDLPGLTRSGANPETLRGLSAGRVATPTLPWEQGSATRKAADPAGQADPLLQPGYLSDLWVVGSALGRALDWDGTALLGWTDPPVIPADPPLVPDFTPGPAAAPGGNPTMWYSPPPQVAGGAACLINWNQPGISPEPAAVLASASVEVDLLGGNPFVWRYVLQLNCHLRGDVIPGVQNSPVGPLLRFLPIFSQMDNGAGTGNVPPMTLAPAITAGDLTGTGKPSIAVAWSGMSFGIRIVVLVDVNVDFSGGTPRSITATIPGASGEVQGTALANGRLFVLAGGQLWSAPVNVAAGTVEPFTQHAWWAQNAPPNWAWATITAADFTGTGSADLLVFYAVAVPGADGATAYRATYRIAYQPAAATGDPAYLGEDVGASIPVTGVPTSLMLGPIDPQTTVLRQTTSQAFRAAAAAKQTRLTSVIPAAASPPPPPPVDVASLAGAIRAAVDPQATVPASVTERLALPAALDKTGGNLQPLGFSPRFPQPFYETVRDGALPWLIPGLSAFPDEAITVVGADPDAIEAILVGANHELSREFVWRGVPALHTATFFTRFWDRRDSTGAPAPDITDISAWTADSDLGSHSPAAGGELAVLLWRGELVRRFPHVTIYAAPAVPVTAGTGTSTRTVDLTQRIDPLFSGTLGGDSAFAGFPFTIQAAMGGNGSLGMYFVFQEHPAAPRFGLAPVTDPAKFGVTPVTWSGLDWAATVPDQAHYDALTYLDTSRASPLWNASLPDSSATAARHQWGVSAAHMAHISYQPPALIAIHAGDLLASPGTGGH